MSLQAVRTDAVTVVDLIDRVLDRGLVINADICVSLAGVELLGLKIRAALASFETAARYGLEFPSGTNLNTAAWKECETGKETCPECGKRVPARELLEDECPWCGWVSRRARSLKSILGAELAGENLR